MTSDSINAASGSLLTSVGGFVSTFAPIVAIGIAIAILAGIGFLIVRAIWHHMNQ